MPWKETNRMDEKEKFIQEMLKGEKPFKKLCEDFGISEKTGHKWKKRFFEQGLSGLTAQIYMLTCNMPRVNTIKDSEMKELAEFFGVDYRKDFLDL